MAGWTASQRLVRAIVGRRPEPGVALDPASTRSSSLQGWSCIYRPDEPVNLEELLYGCVETDLEWRRVERLGSAHLYHQVATSEVPLGLFEWAGTG